MINEALNPFLPYYKGHADGYAIFDVPNNTLQNDQIKGMIDEFPGHTCKEIFTRNVFASNAKRYGIPVDSTQLFLIEISVKTSGK